MNFLRNYKKYNYLYGVIRKKTGRRNALAVGGLSFIVILTLGLFSHRLFDTGGLVHQHKPVSKVKSLSTPNIKLFSKAGKTDSANVAATLNFTHQNITSTYFWVGEPGDADNGYIANKQSAWDEKWYVHFGGLDDPAHRNGYYPAGFALKENPFYFALPYNDISSRGARKSSASSCAAYAMQKQDNYSWCKNIWIAIRRGGNVVYAQWEDAGPFGEDDFGYVFGSSAPTNKTGTAAGIDVSPAVKDYLRLSDVDKVDWAFVVPSAVPPGAWKQTITTSFGDSLN